MSKTKINMVGGGFQHDICSSALNENKYVEWVKDNSANISIHIDNGLLVETNKNKLNFGWVAESSSIVPNIISEVKKNLSKYKEKFEFIFTHDQRLVEIDPNFFKFTLPNALPWIQNKNIFEKTKSFSFIVSNKIMTDGHRFRLNVLEKYKNRVDIDHFGRGFKNELPWTIKTDGVQESGKILALKDYRFSFCFENDNYPSIFCEKITDCFATGTIPIFWGTPNIGDFFDLNGIIIYDDNINIDILDEEFYFSKKESIINNFNICKELLSAEDYLYLNYIK
jgi:hypothetical protein